MMQRPFLKWLSGQAMTWHNVSEFKDTHNSGEYMSANQNVTHGFLVLWAPNLIIIP